MRTTLVLVLLTVVACGEDPAGVGGGGGAPASSTDASTAAGESTMAATVGSSSSSSSSNDTSSSTTSSVGGSGGGGGEPRPAPNGAPCSDGADCESDLCLGSDAGFDAGLCSQPCAGDADCSEGGACVALLSGSFCLETCAESDDCAQPAACKDLGGTTTVCFPGPPGAWTCDPDYFWASDGCDCGCGFYDPDCLIGGCESPGCYETACEFCTDSLGVPVSCLPGLATGSACTSNDECAGGLCVLEAGTGFIGGYCTEDCSAHEKCSGDAECLTGGSTPLCADGCDLAQPDCRVGYVCEDAGNGEGVCLSAWNCAPEYYGAFDGCDCGCGLIDPDCEGSGCADPACSVEQCDYCADALGDPIFCPSSGELGARCDIDSQCLSGVCWKPCTQAPCWLDADGVAKGYCTAPCAQGGLQGICPGDAYCYTMGATGGPYGQGGNWCIANCDPLLPDECRPGYHCNVFTGPTPLSLCMPNAPRIDGDACDFWTECYGGTCYTEGMGFPGGYCSGTCSGPNTCAGFGECYSGECIGECIFQTDCRPGYTCQDWGANLGACYLP